MSLLTLAGAHLAYGHRALLDGAALSIAPGERIALIGRNGEGKSSLIKVLAGLEKLDDGQMQAVQGLTRALVLQEPSFEPGHTVFEAVAQGVAAARALRQRYEAHAEGDDLDALQTQIEALDGWTWEQRVEQAVQRLSLPAQAAVGALSGGTRKRVALAQALVSSPALLLLDEPTNHLDVSAIEWLQSLLTSRRGALLFISHDRAFIDAVATRIVELDRGQLRSYWPRASGAVANAAAAAANAGAGPSSAVGAAADASASAAHGLFAQYLASKAEQLAAEALANARADKLLAQEEVWVRQGVEARRTRSVGRVGRLERLRSQRAERRDLMGRVRMGVDAGIPPGRIVAELKWVSKGFAVVGANPSQAQGESANTQHRLLIDQFSATILRGDKIGLIGPNGVGKTTLLRLILGELEPDSGSVRRGTRLQVAYFDQMRAALDLEATLADTISPGSEWIEIGSQRKHVKSYLGDFLFSPERANSPVRTLSGGERNRLLLARLFALPANVLVLDEPTNDLDIDTLELLEGLLQDYEGTVFLVSHDRRFVDNVVTSTIAWEGDAAYGGHPGLWREYEGGYEDWRQQRARAAVLTQPTPMADAEASRDKPAARAQAKQPVPITPSAAQPSTPAASPRSKLSYKEQRELEALPQRIEALEAEQAQIAKNMADPDFYAREPRQATQLGARHEAIEAELMQCLERWEALGAR